MRHRSEHPPGFALLLSILIVALLVVLALQLQGFSRADYVSATQYEHQVRLDSAAKSGYALALAVLHEDGRNSKADGFFELWADAEWLASLSAAMFEDIRVTVRIQDLSGRIPINGLVTRQGKVDPRIRGLLRRLLGSRHLGVAPERADSLLDSLQDWLDEDDRVSRSGAENAFYKSLSKAYACRNGPLATVDELLLVKGFDPRIVYGTGNTPGLSALVTVFGAGPININTAPAEILEALSDRVDADTAKQWAAFRENPDHDLTRPDWYRRVAALKSVALDPSLITTRSELFAIRCTAELTGFARRIRAVVRREGMEKIRLLAWQVEED